MLREAALSELARRYFTSHGPATVHDFIWWSGLRVADANAGLEMAKRGLVKQTYDARNYWMDVDSKPAGAASLRAHLLPGFDDYLLWYKDRSAPLDPGQAHRLGGGGILNPSIVIDGEVVGTWRRIVKGARVHVETSTFARLNREQKRAIAAAVVKYKRFADSI